MSIFSRIGTSFALAAAALVGSAAKPAQATLVIPPDGILEAEGQGQVTIVPSALTGQVSPGDNFTISFLVNANEADTQGADPSLSVSPNNLQDMTFNFGDNISIVSAGGQTTVDFGGTFSNTTFTGIGPYSSTGVPLSLGQPTSAGVTFTSLTGLTNDSLPGALNVLDGFDLSQGGFERVQIRWPDGSRLVADLDDINFAIPASIPEPNAARMAALVSLLLLAASNRRSRSPEDSISMELTRSELAGAAQQLGMTEKAPTAEPAPAA